MLLHHVTSSSLITCLPGWLVAWVDLGGGGVTNWYESVVVLSLGEGAWSCMHVSCMCVSYICIPCGCCIFIMLIKVVVMSPCGS